MWIQKTEKTHDARAAHLILASVEFPRYELLYALRTVAERTQALSVKSPSLSLVKNFPCENIHNAILCLGRMLPFHKIGFHCHFPTLPTKNSYARETLLAPPNQRSKQPIAVSMDACRPIRMFLMRRICFIRGDCSRCACQDQTLL